MNFYENFLKLCNLAGKSPSGVALEIGISKPAVNRWKNGSTPTDATARKVADYFGVSIADLKESLTLEDLAYMTTKSSGLELAAAHLTKEKTASQEGDGIDDPQRAEFIELFDRLSPDQKARELAFLRGIVSGQDK